MRNFGRALQDALRYWPSILAASLCSLVVAALWGANIGACYPILELTLNGQSISKWMDDQQVASEQRLANLQAELEELPAADNARARNKRSSLAQRISVEQQTLRRIARFRPWIDRHLPQEPFQTVALLVGILMASTLLKHVFMIGNDLLVARVAIDISRGLRQRVFDRAMHMDRASFARLGTSGVSTHITHTSDMLSNALMNALGGAIREPLKIAACLIGAGFICWRLLLLSLIVAPVVGGLLWWITTRLREFSRVLLKRSASFLQVMLESLGNVQTTQAYTMEEFEKRRFAEATWELRRNGLKYVFYTTLSKPIIELLGLGMLSTAILGGAYLVLNEATHIFDIQISNQPLTVSAMLVFFGMLIGASDPLRKLSAVYGTIHSGMIAADVLYPILDQPSEIRDPETPREPPTPHRVLELRHVSFGYEPEQALLDDVSLTIPFGSTVALVGHNGCGKSTLINLLCRFYDPRSGSLLLDGVDLREMRLENLRKRLALVTQHTELFHETVAFNIRYGTPTATDEQVQRAAEEAHAHEFITDVLSDGYQSNVGQNGQKLSGGQRQRLALARALLRNPEILILDEATSQIDLRSEELIRASLAAHRGRRTMIIITHREALLDLADQVYEVAHGKLQPRDRAARHAA